jgi:hypothetical protein
MRRSGWREEDAVFAAKILLKIVLKQNPKVYLKGT